MERKEIVLTRILTVTDIDGYKHMYDNWLAARTHASLEAKHWVKDNGGSYDRSLDRFEPNTTKETFRLKDKNNNVVGTIVIDKDFAQSWVDPWRYRGYP